MERIYFDHAATTPVREEVMEAMRPFFGEKYANASSLHSMGQEAKEALEESRATIASLLGVEREHLYFTSGGTESNNTIIKGLAFQRKQGLFGKRGHFITSMVEHACVMNTGKWLQSQGFDVTFLPVDCDGIVQPEVLQNAIRKDTFLVSIMTANNEIGTIQPIKELSKIAHDAGVPFHTDAVQAFGKIPLELTNVDALSVSSHKLYGPKGVGLLYSKVVFEPLMHGGGHENGRRSGTENVAGIVGFAKASELAFKEMPEESKRQMALRDRLIDGLLQIESSKLNGSRIHRLPNNVNVSFVGVEGESMLLMLDELGIEVSTGSACSSHSLKPSHVLMALGRNAVEAHGSIRLTLGRQTTSAHVDYALEKIPEVVNRLREISPLDPKKYEGKYEDKCFESS